MTCTCPDRVGVCKHIAATMYGVGSRLDIRPELLFKLRKVDHMELIGRAASTASLDQSLGTANGLALSDGELLDIFGIKIESSTQDTAGKKPSRAKARQKPGKKASAQIRAEKFPKKSRQTAVTPAVKKRRGTTAVVVVEVKKSSPRKSALSAKAIAALKASLKSSALSAAAKKKSSKSTAPKAGTPVTAKSSIARTKKAPVKKPAKPSTNTQRTK